ncbi:MAG: DUF4864 domain-containing protein [Orrella sp.]
MSTNVPDTYSASTSRHGLNHPMAFNNLSLRYLALLLLLVSGLALAEPTEKTDNPVRAVIQGQLDAFLEDDFDTAFQYAAPNIQILFGHPRRFAQMVVNNYPMVWRPAEVQYLGASRSGPYAFQRVMITDQDNALHLLLYQLVPINQRWRISGVEILALPGEQI